MADRRTLSFQHGFEECEDVFGYEGVAFGGGVDAVGLDGSGDVVDVGVEEGQERDTELFGSQHVSFIDALNVVLTVIWRESDAGERYLYTRVLQRGDDLVEVGARGGDGKAAESVVASELYDGDGGMRGDHAFEPVDGVFAGVSADAHVENAVVIAA